ncbi:hypothetical protein [Spirochaeta cellobiosiphila]|uniref:hypothetical protein n=1 Tax=Spirochaeta cellobiosiphila TaxID=504483 RepID=UPI0004102290|nr:hypothetical protein [Spirochaeta cellobiosiphila]
MESKKAEHKVYGMDWKSPFKGFTHDDSIFSLCWFSDNKTFASGGLDKKVRIWNGDTGQEVKTLSTGGSRWLNSIALSPDEKYLVSGEKTLTVWDTTNWKKVYSLKGCKRESHVIRFSPDGQWIIAGYGFAGTNTKPTDLLVWSMETGELVHKLRHKHTIYSALFVKEGTMLITGDTEGLLSIWDTKTWSLIKELPPAKEGYSYWVLGMDLSPREDSLLILRRNGFSLLDMTSLEIQSINLPITKPQGNIIQWLSEDKWLLNSDPQTLAYYDQSKDTLVPLKSFSERINRVALSPDKKSLLIICERKIHLFHTETMEEKKATPMLPSSSIRSMVISHEGNYLAASDQNDSFVWEVKTGKAIKKLPKTAGPMVFIDDYRLIICSAFTLHDLNILEEKPGSTLDISNQLKGSPLGVFYEPMKGIGILTNKREILFIDVENLEVEKKISFSGEIHNFAYSNNAQTLCVTETFGSQLSFIDIKKEEQSHVPIPTETGLRSLAISPKSEEIYAIDGQCNVLVWDSKTGNSKILWEEQFPSDHNSWQQPSKTIALSTCGSKLAFIYSNQLILIIDSKSGEERERVPFEGKASISFLEFTKDGNLIVASEEGLITLLLLN